MPDVGLLLVRLVVLLSIGVFTQAPLDINETAKKVLKDPNQIPPNIYQWIERNAHICTDVPVNGANSVNFLNAVEGARCLLCPEPRSGQPPKMACAVEVRLNSVDLNIGCHRIPELCIIDLRERYAEFFAAGGRMPKVPSRDNLPIDSAEIFLAIGNPFDEKPTTEEPVEEETTTVRANQFTPDAGSAVIVDFSTSDFSATKNAAKVNRRQLKKRPEEEVNAPKSRELIPPPSKRGKRPIDDNDKNIDEQDQKALKTCRDKHELCCFWASAGECDENPFWMRVNCAKTCGTCNCKVRNANKCVSTGVECQTTTISSTTRIKSTSSSTSKLISTSIKTTTKSTTRKASSRALPSEQRTRSRLRRPPSSQRAGPGDSRPPGHRPQRPPLGLSQRVTSTTSITVSKSRRKATDEDPDYRSPDAMDDGGGGDYGGGDYDDVNDNLGDVGNDGDDIGDILTNGGDDTDNASNDEEKEMTPSLLFPSEVSSTTSTSTSASTPSTSRSTCFNFNRLCRFWADLGECERNPFWMRPHCQKACGSCGEKIEDVLVPSQNKDCENQHIFCPFWAFIGECSANARWMSVNCKASCQLC